jgi:hypothetical protein
MPHTLNDPDYKKRALSASNDGRAIQVTATDLPGTAVHTALPSPAANEWDELFLFAVNVTATAVELTLYWGAETGDDRIILSIPPKSGLVNIISGLLLHNSGQVTAAASTANALLLYGFVHRYEHV